MRRKGIPGDCCGDTCGNKVRKINGISPDPNGEFSISAGAGVGITQDQNGITIDASAASGVLTINGQAPDADGNFDGVITGQPGSIGTNLKPVKINAQGRAVPVDNNLVDTASGQFIQGAKVFDSDTYTTIGIRSSRVSGKLGGIQFKDGSNNVISTLEVDVDGDVHFENKPNTGVMIDNQRSYDTDNETDIVTIGSLKNSTDVMRTENVIPLNGGLFLQRNIVIPDITSSTLIRQIDIQAKKTADGEFFTIGSMQYRRYANRTRWRTLITRYMDTPENTSSLIFDVFDSGRVYLFIENIVNGTTTNHTIVDSTP